MHNSIFDSIVETILIIARWRGFLTLFFLGMTMLSIMTINNSTSYNIYFKRISISNNVCIVSSKEAF
jgi:hypothetical protein